MIPLSRWVVAAALVSVAAGASGAMAVSRALSAAESREPAELPIFEDRFMREFELPESKRALVRTILRDDRERRRAIEGEAVASPGMHERLERASRQADAQLRGILPPPQRAKYDAWIGRARLDSGSR